jgi:hypothetical protein
MGEDRDNQPKTAANVGSPRAALLAQTGGIANASGAKER